eukprot:5307656-Pleurochrysis_carterae.AAC.8
MALILHTCAVVITNGCNGVLFCKNTIISANEQSVALCMLHEFFAPDCRVYAIVAAMVFPVVLAFCAGQILVEA